MPGEDTSRNAAKSHLHPKQRISHTKSRNGCYKCKQRRVKCDEVRPMCNACSVRGDDCVYPSPGGARERERDQRRRQRPVFRGPSSESIQTDTQRVPFRPLSFKFSAPEEPQIIGPSLNMGNLNLLQHFILHTSKKMTLHKIKTEVWERVFLDLATTNDFLMHLVLALAGADILITEKSNPSLSWSPSLHSIMEHHQRGLAGLQDALCAIVEPDAEALLAGSMLVVGFAFASLGIKDLDPSIGTSQDSSLRGSSTPLQIRWLHLVRGITSIMGQFWSTLRRCRLRPLLFFNNANDDWKLCETEILSNVVQLNQNIKSKRLRKFALGANHALLDLRDICTALHDSENFEGSETSLSNATPRSDHSGRTSLSACEQAIDVVESLYMRILYVLHMKPLNPRSSSPTDLEIQFDLEDAAISAWPHDLSEEFISILDSRHGHVDALLLGVSLTILAHLYSTIAILEDIWYLGKTCDGEIYKINALIHGLGDERLMRLMEWIVDLIQG
ncbi:hypothetical protein ZTR_07498 [Talaromyces verruculosus]|nr:hypothetical protein ZTR_07498 [Talaromyces verruculosus]